MKTIKLFFLSFLLISLILSPSLAIKAQENEELANALLEFEIDSVDAKSLNIEEPNALPGQFKYKWQLFKENISLLFTFNEEAKVEKLEEISQRRLIEAKKLSEQGTDNAALKVKEALDKYQEVKNKINERLANNPQLKEKVLQKIDAQQLKHQQILSSVIDKLENKTSEDIVNKIKNIKEESALNWYKNDRDNLQERLNTALENNAVGSKFKQLQNIASLEEMDSILPMEAQDAINATRLKAQKDLASKLKKIEESDIDKFNKYISNIKTDAINKEKFISNLKDNTALPTELRQEAASIFQSYTSRLQNRFENLSDEEKEKFLEQFENTLRSHPANLEFLESIDDEKYRARVKELIEIQSQGIKEKIQNTTDPVKLRSLQQNLQNYPVLRRQIQSQQEKINSLLSAPLPSLVPNPDSN